MEVFVMKISVSLLITVLITSNVVAEKLSMESKTVGKNGRTLGIKNSTKEETKYHATGTRRVSGTARVSRSTVSNLPVEPCYTSFFTNATPPDGLRDPKNSNIKYICQMTRSKTEFVYSTMFDLDQGIAVVAGYKLKPGDDAFQKRTAFVWNPTPDIPNDRQGSDVVYSKANPYGFQKGHLISKRTFSSEKERCESTYTYTNAVPQAPKFNNDGWKEYEIRIRQYAKKECLLQQQQLQQQDQPILYLLTGTSSVRIDHKTPPNPIPKSPVGHIGNPIYGMIRIPNSMWTAGCCVRPKGQTTESFAVIGNNVNDKDQTLTQKVTVAQLQIILQADGNTINNGVNLFPGNPACLNNDLGKALPDRVIEQS